MDSMTEMFYDESSGILRDMRRGMLLGKETDWKEQEAIQEIFRGVHTLKADSAMMLYENMAELSSVLESLLYCFRGEGKTVTEPERFEQIVNAYLDFFEHETDELPKGKTPKDEAGELLREIRQFTEEITAVMEDEEAVAYQKEISKPTRQVFYIASASDEEMPELDAELSAGAETSENEREAAVKKKPEEEKSVVKGNKKKYMISDDDRERVCQSTRDLLRIIDNLEYSFGNGESGSISVEQLERLKKIQCDLSEVKKALVNTDFGPVAKKMAIVVDEMSEQLQKPVKLIVKGEDTLVDSERREAISGALIHLIRNAVDHGIEDMETRERFGKSPMGLIKLRFSTEDGHLKVSVKDDGAGIDTEKILRAAAANNLLEKEPEEYTEREIYNLMLMNGLTTKEKVNEYSGRGVGMDVINHNVAAFGGKLKISSKKGMGTTISMKF